ncbi:putative cyclin-D6-1-like isoform X2 [Hibiscus syriacus]|uniref:Cyclin-D6-1-like isoform X2 n=1 Tax=Hibiscus syriacus TaxID=106335 RepID=A0A6A2XE15_HIBSY|nr:putative cyclin-D6-1-like isoform X2 [Hibiscus syriacus]
MELDLENPLLNFNSSLFLLEPDHMPTQNYINTLEACHLHISLRREAISSISQFSCKLGLFSSYLAINYLDPFLSSQTKLVLQQPQTWILRLVSISCLSLAAKMTKLEFPLDDFQVDGGFAFDAQAVERMEYLILGALKWRMRSITPFSFVSFFISLFKLKEVPVSQAIKARALQLIFKAQIDTKLLEFESSIVAASALLFASHELFPLQFPSFRKAISSCSYVNKENMIKCFNSVQKIAKEGYESILDMVSNSNTPVNVFDRHISSSGSEMSTVGATAVISMTQRDIKRRKINDYGTIIKGSTSLRSKSKVLIYGPL